MTDFDVIVVGGGHNGLVTAAYLAQDGYRVAVFEKRAIVGGAVATAEIVPGYRFDLGGSAHILIRLTPIVEELELEKHGLDYIELDPMFFAPFEDGDHIFIYRDIDRTCDELERKYPGEGEAYRRFVDDWTPFAHAVRDAFLSPPTASRLIRAFSRRKMALAWKYALPSILKPYGQVIREYFSEPKVQAMIAWMAAQSGPPPTEPMSAPFALWHPLYHESGVARPRGGSGMLSIALRRKIESCGGTVQTGSPVARIVVNGSNATGVLLESGERYSARAIVSGTHVLETFGPLLGEKHRPSISSRVGNGFGVMLRLALDSPVRYRHGPSDAARTGLQLICRDIGQIDHAYGQYLGRMPATDPPLVAMTFSAVDDSLAPPGCEVLWLWGQYFPYELADGASWDTVGATVRETLINQFERFAPGTRDSIVGELMQHPVWLEKELGLLRGNVMHIEMSIDQMFMLRPALGMSQYRSHIKGLYLTGASTHPGGGIMGASGRNAAGLVRRDLRRRRL